MTPTWAEVIREGFNARLAEVHTAMPAKVVAYDAAAQTVDVQPLVKRLVANEDGALVAESYPQIPAVPVVFPRAGDNWITFPIAADDVVLLVFCERPLDAWRAADAESDPGDTRMHALGDAVAIPGVYPTARPLTTSSTAMVLTAAGELHLGGLNPAEFVALATKSDNRMSALETKVNDLITAFNAHMHATAGTGAPSPPTPVPGSIPAVALTPGTSVAATKAKAV